MNPIIEAIDDGHQSHIGHCRRCQTPWPCMVIRDARIANHDYVRTRQHDAAVARLASR